MMILRRFAQGLDSIPAGTAWYLADLGRAVGRQELFTRQSLQRLKVLREQAVMDSQAPGSDEGRRGGILSPEGPGCSMAVSWE